MTIQIHDNLPPKQPFRWRDRKGEFHYLKDMDTKHLFFTLRMIWNHTVPKNFKIYPYKEYTFSSFYSIKYLAEAVRKILDELETRDDLFPYAIHCLSIMRQYVKSTCKAQLPCA